MESRLIHGLLRRATIAAWVSAGLACGGEPKSAPEAPAQAASTPSTSPPDEAASPANAPADTGTENAEGATEAPKPPPLTPVGVPECDKFVERFVTCLERHVPPEQREDKMRELNTHRARWRELLNIQEGKVAAGLACRGVAQRLKSDLIVDYGCEF